MQVSRRHLLVTMLGLVSWACTQPPPRPAAPTSAAPPAEFGVWDREAKAILSDALETLQTFENFAAFRLAAARESERRSANELAWDPPPSRAWDESTHVARGLHNRAEQLFLAVSKTALDASAWREQRDLAQWTHDLLDLGDALDAFRVRVGYLAPDGDGAAAWEVLDRAWARFDATAAHWGVSRAEPIGCGSPG